MVHEVGLAVLDAEDAVGTDIFARTAAYAFILVEIQCGHIFEVSELVHGQAPHERNGAASQSSVAAKAVMPMIGRECRISRSTPDKEVKGVEPVKFMAR